VGGRNGFVVGGLNGLVVGGLIGGGVNGLVVGGFDGLVVGGFEVGGLNGLVVGGLPTVLPTFGLPPNASRLMPTAPSAITADSKSAERNFICPLLVLGPMADSTNTNGAANSGRFLRPGS
jgi:hypothetical protein